MTTPPFWLGVALGIAFAGLGLAILSWRARGAAQLAPAGPPSGAPDEPLPRTLLQTRAQWGLAIGALSAAAALIVVLLDSPTAFHSNERMRLYVYGVFAAGGLAYSAVCAATRYTHRGEVALDERDQEILARAPRVQAAAILVTLLVWAIALTELYWDSGQVPIAFPFLIFLSCCVVGLLAFSAGILIGYRRA